MQLPICILQREPLYVHVHRVALGDHAQQQLPSTYSYDPSSGFYYDSATGLYYDPKTQVIFSIPDGCVYFTLLSIASVPLQ